MAATPVYSNGTWGEVTGGTLNGVYAPRPIEGATRTETYTVRNAQITLTCPEPGYDPLPLDLGDKTFSRVVPDVDPVWAAWEANDQLPDLTPIPEPDEVKLPRLKLEKAFALEAAWSTRVAAGVSVGGVSYGITQGDVSLLTGAFVLAQTAVAAGAITADGPFTLIDISGVPHDYTMQTLTVAMLTYGQARSALSQEYAVLAATIEGASTVAEVQAITISFS